MFGNIALPYYSAACASHHAIISIAHSLRREIQHLGIDVVCLETGVPAALRSDMNYRVRKRAGLKS